MVVSQNRPKVPFCFEIVPVEDNGRTYFFAAEAESEMNNWIAAIDTILEAIRNTELRQKRAYVTVEVGLLSGLRISGDLPVVIARELSDLEDVPSDAKRIDERGWYAHSSFSQSTKLMKTTGTLTSTLRLSACCPFSANSTGTSTTCTSRR